MVCMKTATQNSENNQIHTKTMKALLLLLALPPLFSLGVWPLSVFVSLFAFDSPGAERSIPTLLVVLSVWLYPLPVLMGLVRLWKAFRSGEYSALRRGVLFSYGPAAVVVALYVLLSWLSGGKFA